MRTALDNRVGRLYHYQSFNQEHLANTLERGVIRFADPSSINDPWDCKPTFSVPETPAEREALIQYLKAASERQTPDVDPAARARISPRPRSTRSSIRHGDSGLQDSDHLPRCARRFRIAGPGEKFAGDVSDNPVANRSVSTGDNSVWPGPFGISVEVEHHQRIKFSRIGSPPPHTGAVGISVCKNRFPQFTAPL